MSIRSETSDDYGAVIAVLGERFRVIEAADESQWILQGRKNSNERWPWRAVGYFLTRDALIAHCISRCRGQIDPVAKQTLTALPDFYARTKQ